MAEELTNIPEAPEPELTLTPNVDSSQAIQLDAKIEAPVEQGAPAQEDSLR